MTTVGLLFVLAGCSSSALEPVGVVEISDIEVTPSELSVSGGHLASFDVKAYGADGNRLGNAPISFTSSDPSVAVVDGDGTVWAFRSGDVSVVAKPGRGATGKNLPPGQEKRSARVGVPEVAANRPGTVTDLAIDEVNGSTVTLGFTEVDDGTGAPADYVVRFQMSPLSWGDAAEVLFGSCATPVSGREVGSRRSCSVENLAGGTRFEFQLVAFRGSLNGDLVYGDLSNVVSATTPSGSTASAGSPWVNVDFENWASTEELRSDRSTFAVENLNVEKTYLDTGTGFEGLTRSMRYDWVNQGTQSVSIGRGIRLPEAVKELWVEVALKWSPNFTSCHPEDPPCDHKTLFLQVTPDMNGRWEVHFGGGAGETGPDANVTMGAAHGRVEGDPNDSRWYLSDIPWPRPYVGANQYYDGQWHLVRLHAKHSTDENTLDGRMRLWVDGQLLYDTQQLEQTHGSPRFSTREGTKIHGILLGRNKDKGLDSGTESMWIGRIRAWKDDPGW